MAAFLFHTTSVFLFPGKIQTVSTGREKYWGIMSPNRPFLKIDPMLTADLKEITYPEHQASEKKMVAALKRIETQADYKRMLGWLYGFYSPVEDLISRALTEDIFPDIANRCRAYLILTDMRNSGESDATPGICTELPVIDSPERGLGALYVLEGSTLGGRIIAEMITRRLGPSTSLGFFNGYGAETEKMWQSFKDFLNKPRTAEEQAAIIDGAKATFITFKNWIGRHELQPQL